MIFVQHMLCLYKRPKHVGLFPVGVALTSLKSACCALCLALTLWACPALTVAMAAPADTNNSALDADALPPPGLNPAQLQAWDLNRVHRVFSILLTKGQNVRLMGEIPPSAADLAANGDLLAPVSNILWCKARQDQATLLGLYMADGRWIMSTGQPFATLSLVEAAPIFGMVATLLEDLNTLENKYPPHKAFKAYAQGVDQLLNETLLAFRERSGHSLEALGDVLFVAFGMVLEQSYQLTQLALRAEDMRAYRSAFEAQARRLELFRQMLTTCTLSYGLTVDLPLYPLLGVVEKVLVEIESGVDFPTGDALRRMLDVLELERAPLVQRCPQPEPPASKHPEMRMPRPMFKPLNPF